MYESVVPETGLTASEVGVQRGSGFLRVHPVHAHTRGSQYSPGWKWSQGCQSHRKKAEGTGDQSSVTQATLVALRPPEASAEGWEPGPVTIAEMSRLHPLKLLLKSSKSFS